MTTEKEKIGDSLKKLEKIVQWFETQEDIDVQEGLKKVKEGAELIGALKAKLKKVENEFQEVKKGLQVDGE